MTTLKIITTSIVALLMGALTCSAHGQRISDPYEQQIRPLLAKNCYACHSGSAPKGGLALDTQAGLHKGGLSGPAYIAHQAERSLLLRVVRHDAGVPAMPPGSKLSDSDVSILSRWIAAGAPMPTTGVVAPSTANIKTWAFKPPHLVARLPVVRDTAWGRTPIDRFILARLEAKGLKPSQQADRRTLIRRATYDITGLPPTPQEVVAFLNDTRPNSYERLVDRLLASPGYGERWGRHWLDVVHYGDTHGYDKDKRRNNAWPYRDYVINAFNKDKPYARFVREQVAGDVLFPMEPEATVATGMLAAGPWDFVGNLELGEGTVEKEKTRLIDRDDIVSNVMSTFDSVTIHCARCHNHKFDPIPQRDYYRLQAVFAGIDRGDRPNYDKANMVRGAALQKQRTAFEQRRDTANRTIQAITNPTIEQIDHEIQAAKDRLSDLPAPVLGAGSPSNGYHSDISSTQNVSRWVQVDLGSEVPIDSVRLIPARPTDFKDTPGFGFPLRYSVSVSRTPDFKEAQIIDDSTARDVANPGDSPINIAASGVNCRFVRITATKLWSRTNDFVFALAELQVLENHRNRAVGKPVTAQESIEQGRWSTRFLTDNYDSRNPLPDLSDLKTANLVAARETQQAAIVALRKRRNAEVESKIDPATRATRDGALQDLAKVDKEIANLPEPTNVYGIISHAPRPIWVLNRGDVEQHGEKVAPGALSAVPGLNCDFSPAALGDEGKARAELAEWIVNPANTLTWRSIVNRIWGYHFSGGIVDTPDDFGRNGGLPSHPELLDWLANWFYRDGQSMKRLHKMIMLSAVYRQSSNIDKTNRGERVDADNRLLWHMNARRLEAEEIRDSVLAISGKLNLQAGGPGFELFRFKDDHSPIYDYSDAALAQQPVGFRRSVYEFVVRSVPDPFIECLDGADPNARTPVRNTTLTPLQALAMRNDPFMITQSDFVAKRLAAQTQSVVKQIDLAYSLVLSRGPSPAERSALVLYAARHGLANACRMLLNTNEFIFVD